MTLSLPSLYVFDECQQDPSIIISPGLQMNRYPLFVRASHFKPSVSAVLDRLAPN
jgi:hypothetical protein